VLNQLRARRLWEDGYIRTGIPCRYCSELADTLRVIHTATIDIASPATEMSVEA
jgi:hypothetical protein